MVSKQSSGLGFWLMQIIAAAVHVNVVASLEWNFETSLGFYGAYHQNPMNQLIHFIFIPLIWWTMCVCLCYLPLFGLHFNLPFTGIPVTWGTAQLLVYVVYYAQLDPMGGSIFSAVLVLGYLLANRLVQSEIKPAKQGPQAKPVSAEGWRWYHFAIALHVLGWYMQIHPGHAIYEGVKPALLDSLGQALTVAPLFAFYEGLWFLGFAAPLQAKVLTLVAAHRAQMCSQNASYPFCTSA